MYEVTWINLLGNRLVASRHRTKVKAQQVAARMNDPKRTLWGFVPHFKPHARVRKARRVSQ